MQPHVTRGACHSYTPRVAASGHPAVAVVLAAGAGRRFGGVTHKLDAVLDPSGRDPRTVLARAVDAAIASAIGPVIVVTGAPFDTVLPDDVVRVDNPRWERGQLTSLHAGLVAAGERGAAAAVVGLGDQPFVPAAAWRDVAAAPDGIAIAVATYPAPDGTRKRGNPVRLRADVWSLLADELDAAGPSAIVDHGARGLMRLRPDLVGEIPCRHPAFDGDADIDTLEDLARWQSSSSTSSP
jgi:molybdenum cofactor cytidylyltransferase